MTTTAPAAEKRTLREALDMVIAASFALAGLADPIIRRDQVLALTGLSSTSLQRQVDAKKFPAPVALDTRTVGWRLTEVNEWINSRPRTKAA